MTGCRPGTIVLSLALATPWAPPGETPPAGPQTRPMSLTALWRDEPSDPARVRIDQVPGITEPSDLLLVDGALYTVSDSRKSVYRLVLDGPQGALTGSRAADPAGITGKTDLEALTRLAGGQVLISNETDGSLLVLAPFPEKVCAVWSTGVAGTCFFGRPNCGVEALAAVPGGLFVAKERDPRSAWLFDLPETPCADTALSGRTYLRLPEEIGGDIGAATFDAATGHLLVVARSVQRVMELRLPERPAGDTSPRSLSLVGSFSYAATEDALDYAGPAFHQVEGIAVDDRRVLHLIVDNNERLSRRFGNRNAALLRFYPPPRS